MARKAPCTDASDEAELDDRRERSAIQVRTERSIVTARYREKVSGR
jgi:hypothetical protein